jgi:hypothetical protein
MEAYRCGTCDGLVFFDNSLCLACRSELGFDLAAGAIVVLGPSARRCANKLVARCNWLVAADDPNPLCASCRLTTVRPNDSELDALAAFAEAEAAKRRVIAQLAELGLPVTDVSFELLSSSRLPVITGHLGGVITLDLSESDDAHREFVRLQLGEPYRTVLGHLRHEIAHYFWPLLVESGGRIDEFRARFGDERQPYEAALERHYRQAPHDPDWSKTHVSQYATMHPWEDWAETFAHYLHIRAGLATAESLGLVAGEPSRSAGAVAWSAPEPTEVGGMIGRWLALTFALNGMSRSIGRGDLYPFVLSPGVVMKLDFVHRCVADWNPARAGATL